MRGGTPFPGLGILIGAAAFSCTSAIGVGEAVPTDLAPTEAAPFYTSTFAKIPTVPALTDIGRVLFYDPSLSASGKMACATCHDPGRAFGPPNDSPVQPGGSDLRKFGVRAVPSLKYGQNIPPFTEHYFDDDGDDSVDQGPAGGRTWDGRAQSAHDQARLPLLSPFEMANANADEVVSKVQSAGYAARFRNVFGDDVFDDKASAFKAVLMALETFQQSPAEFYPYSSKYDAWLRHETSLSWAELRGLAAFNDPAKGNCARCHPSAMKKGAFPQFTDFGYAAVGAPRNPAVPANADRHYYDLGLCGPLRSDLSDRKRYCGMFRTPSLRNVATRRAFFHNGVLHRLDDVVRFYAERDTQPQRWYSREPTGAAVKFDDLPPQYRGNVDIQPPFDRHAGDAPALSEADIADIVAFLNALTDGYEVRRGGETASSASVLMSLNITCGCKKASE
ncbi:MAG TPA: cytochrome c peroxidase [Steroidobacteraceae bacterium]|nr:cytochrome c peroxidase [Steroidobacteraceae bacterium]